LRFGYNEKQLRELQDLSLKLKTAYIKRAEQAKKVTHHRKSSPYPVIVCGDFNDTPVSFAYHKMSTGLKDAFLQKGKGRGNTYLGRFSLRIDYILYSNGIEALEFDKIEAELSDHYPILSNFRIY
jgi:endonuclease/exonuclease/phosphatase (EEP) superfamily protein YafD